MQRNFPIKISQYSRRNLLGLYGIGGIVIFGWVFLPALLTAPPAAMVIVGGMLIVAWVFVYVLTLGKKLTLTSQGVTYKDPRKQFGFLYKDIERVGYYSRAYGGGVPGGGLGVSIPIRRARIFLENPTSPIEIDLHFFSEENQRLLLHVIAEQAPHAQFGDRTRSDTCSARGPVLV